MCNGDRRKGFCKLEKCFIFSDKSTNVSLCPMVTDVSVFVKLKNVSFFHISRLMFLCVQWLICLYS